MAKVRYLAADNCLKPGLKLIGAKQGSTADSTRKRIYDMIPDTLTSYAETFLGSGAILVGKPEVDNEVVNDINPFVINFYRCMKKNPLRLWKAIQLQIDGMCAEKFLSIRMNPPAFTQDEGYPAAAWYYAINKWARNGIVRFSQKGLCNSTWCGQVTGRGLYDKEWYERVYKRIRDVRFYNKTYQQFLTENVPNPDDTMVVLDPPYIDVFTSYMGIKFTRQDHYELAKILRYAKFYWLLTINDHPLVRKWYKPFNFYDNTVFYSCSNTSAGRGNRAELIITNY